MLVRLTSVERIRDPGDHFHFFGEEGELELAFFFFAGAGALLFLPILLDRMKDVGFIFDFILLSKL